VARPTPAERRLDADIARWRADPVAFAHEHFVIADTRRPIELQPHQQQIVRALFTPPYPSEAVYSTVKKSGKTAIGALIGLYVGMCHAREGTEIIVAANDEEQAVSRVFADIKFCVEQDPVFVGSPKDIQGKQITLRNGVGIKAISSDYGSAAGSRHALAIFDELWKYDSESAQRLYDELTAIPTLDFSMRLVVSMAGFEGESKTLKALYDRAMSGKRILEDVPVFRNGSLFAYWDSGLEARRMPWLQGEKGAAYYAEQALALRPGQFRRYHLNEWTAGSEAFVTAEQWDGCVSPARRPFLLGDKQVSGSVFVGVDVGIKRDSSAVVAVERTPSTPMRQSNIRLVAHEVWTPNAKAGEVVEIEETVYAYLRALLTCGWRVEIVHYDPSQMLPTAQRLNREGFAQVIEYPQEGNRLTMMGNELVGAIKGRNLELYEDAEMKRSALQAVAQETNRGWKISKVKTKHSIDVIVALAMAVQGARATPPHSYASGSTDPDPYYEVPQAGAWRDIGDERRRGLAAATRR
jgi:phage terminase large subunit-like protein